VQHLEHDHRVRAAARLTYDTVYPREEWTPLPFADAEKFPHHIPEWKFVAELRVAEPVGCLSHWHPDWRAA